MLDPSLILILARSALLGMVVTLSGLADIRLRDKGQYGIFPHMVWGWAATLGGWSSVLVCLDAVIRGIG